MRILLAIVAAVGIGFAAAYFLAAKQAGSRLKAEHAAAEADWQAEKAALEQALKAARAEAGKVQRITTTEQVVITNRASAQQIIAELIQLRPENSEESRNRSMKRIIHHFQLLAELGTEAIPAIRDFLAENKDVDYTAEDLSESGERAGRRRWGARTQVRTDFLVPPSLRLGLVDVLDQIGGEAAEEIMGQMLATTGRGVEVAYLARLLQENTPGKYRDVAITAAKELLANPPSVDQPNRLDENARAYLYQVLTMYGDTSFAENAQHALVTPDGRIDRQALSYLTTTLKDQSVATIHAAYNDPRITNQWEKSNLLNAALAYTGQNPLANQMLAEVLANESIPSGVRAFTVQNLAGGLRSEIPNDPEIAKARLEALTQVRLAVKDARIIKAIEDTALNLHRVITGQPVRSPFLNPSQGTTEQP
jgi:hypothetical protein